FATTAPSGHGDDFGRGTTPKKAPACTSAEVLRSGEGFQRWVCWSFSATVASGRGLQSGAGRGRSTEARVEEILPEVTPNGPVVTSWLHVHHLRRQRCGHHAMAVRESVLAAESQVHGHRVQGARAWRPRPLRLDEAPDVALVVVLGEIAGLPALDSASGRNLSGHDAIAQVGREHAHP